MLCQAAVDHVLACQNRLARRLGHGQRHWCGGTHISPQVQPGDVPPAPPGSLAAAQLLQLGVTVHTLIRCLQTQAAAAVFNFIACTRCCILPQWEWELDCLSACVWLCAQNEDCHWQKESWEAIMATQIPPNSLSSLFPYFVHLTGPSLPYKLLSPQQQLAPSLPSQGKCILLSPFPPLVCTLIRQLCQIQKRIFDCSNVLRRAECSVIPLASTSCVLIT